MELAHRYAALLTAPEGHLREAPADGFADDRSELEPQAHWFAGDFGRCFRTTLKLDEADNEALTYPG